MAATHQPAGALQVRQLLASVRARLGVSQLRRAFHDRAYVFDVGAEVQQLRRLDVAADMSARERAVWAHGGVMVAPSILAADFSRLREQVGEVLDAGAPVVHVDVMDGHFVPPITVGPIVVAALCEQVRAAGAAMDVHLMIERPERHAAEFVKAGADSITIHAEATAHVAYAAQLIHEGSVQVGVAINPGTPVQALSEVAGEIDLVLCMTVNPGWGGQAFIERSPGKVRGARALVGAGVAVEVDGGIDAQTGPSCRQAGASVFVAGSAIFGSTRPGEAYRAIASAVGAGPGVEAAAVGGGGDDRR
jgi:ribulose-phosphate 3-epimerase